MDLEQELPLGYWICLVGIVVKAFTSRDEYLEFDFRLQCGNFSWLSHIRDLKIGPSVATLPGVWPDSQCWDWLVWCHYTVTGWGRKFDLQLMIDWRIRFTTQWWGALRIKSFKAAVISNLHVSVAAHKLFWAGPSLDTLACCWDIEQSNRVQHTVEFLDRKLKFIQSMHCDTEISNNHKCY